MIPLASLVFDFADFASTSEVFLDTDEERLVFVVLGLAAPLLFIAAAGEEECEGLSSPVQFSALTLCRHLAFVSVIAVGQGREDGSTSWARARSYKIELVAKRWSGVSAD